MTHDLDRSTRYALAALAVVLVVATAVSITLRGPAPLPADANPSRFSSARAISELTHFMKADVSRAVGTAGHEAARARLVARLESLGYSVTTQGRFTCTAAVTCSEITNVIAQRPSDRGRGPGVLLTAHYDSVPAGPGASDDGSGVAVILEIARALQSESPARPVRFLITDGEELGLVGARVSVSDRGLQSLADVVVNIEARGTSGPSFMFETSRRNSELIRTFSRSVSRPVSTSLFVNIYELLPNDTDLTVFKDAGVDGFNFGAIRNPWAYHTPLDTIGRIDRRTLQHHGDNVLALVRELARKKMEARSDDAVYFDVLSLTTFWWPAAFSLPIAIALLIGSGVLAFLRRKEIGYALFYVPVLIVTVTFLGLLLTAFGTLRSGDTKWLATPGPLLAAMWLAGAGTAIVFASRALRRASPAGLLTSVVLWWNGLGVLSAFTLTGGSYLLIVPGLLLLMAAAIATRHERGSGVLSLLALATTCALWLPFACVLYEALAAPALTAIALILTFVAMTVAPLIADVALRPASAGIAAAFVLALLSSTLPPATPEHPRTANLILYCEQGQAARWFATSTPAHLKVAGSFDSRLRTMLPWAPAARGFAADATEFSIAPPAIAATTERAGGTVHTRFRIQSERIAARVIIAFRTTAIVRSIAVNQAQAPIARMNDDPWKRVSVYGRGATIDVETSGAIDEAWAYDVSYGLPAGAGNLMKARQLDAAVPFQDGDIMVASRRVPLP